MNLQLFILIESLFIKCNKIREGSQFIYIFCSFERPIGTINFHSFITFRLLGPALSIIQFLLIMITYNLSQVLVSLLMSRSTLCVEVRPPSFKNWLNLFSFLLLILVFLQFFELYHHHSLGLNLLVYFIQTAMYNNILGIVTALSLSNIKNLTKIHPEATTLKPYSVI